MHNPTVINEMHVLSS